MKQSLKHKLKKLNPRKSAEPLGRITNETVAEHRERVLAGGRKFKYPVQYSRHKLVINSILITIGTLLLFVVVGWWQLYPAQNYSRFMYRVTQLVPVPVARVDGSFVPYSDYLRRLTSSLYYLQTQNQINLNTTDGQRQVEFSKRRALDAAVFDTYVRKIAKEQKVTISNKEVDEFIKSEQLDNKNISLETYETTVLKRIYNWSLNEYREVVRTELLKRKVAFKLDTVAQAKVASIRQRLADGADFAELARTQSDDEATKANGGAVMVPVNNQDINGLIANALKLEPGQVSGVIEGSDGYYIIKLTSKNETTVEYAQIKVTPNVLTQRYEQVQKDNKIKEYIKVEATENSQG